MMGIHYRDCGRRVPHRPALDGGGHIDRTSTRRSSTCPPHGIGPATSAHLDPEQLAGKVDLLRKVLAADGVRSPSAVAQAMGLGGAALEQVLRAHEERD